MNSEWTDKDWDFWSKQISRWLNSMTDFEIKRTNWDLMAPHVNKRIDHEIIRRKTKKD